MYAPKPDGNGQRRIYDKGYEQILQRGVEYFPFRSFIFFSLT